MPRYSYKLVFITSTSLPDRMVLLRRVSDGIAILNALATGSLTLEAEERHDRYRGTIPIEHLAGKNEEEIWRLFDGEIDVAQALALPLKGRPVDPAQNGRWPSCPQDVRNFLDDIGPAGMYRLRHFGALMLLKIKIGSHLYAVQPRQRAAIDAGLDELETAVAYDADLNSCCRDLLYLR